MTTRIFRIIFALLGLSALLTEIVVLVSENTFNAGNFFSFFTVLSNIAAVSVLAYFGLKKNPSKRAESFRAAATLYMVMTGVIFAILLSGITDVRLSATPWDNIVLHYIMPIVVAVDWYPYPFLNPKTSSYATVLIVVCVLAVGVIIATIAMKAYAKRHVK